MNAHDIILAPVITERSMDGMQKNKFTFKVAKSANKIEIAKAAEEVFPGVVVTKVNTINVRGRLRRQGRYEGRTPSWKKAIITLDPKGKSIEFFDGMY